MGYFKNILQFVFSQQAGARILITRKNTSYIICVCLTFPVTFYAVQDCLSRVHAAGAIGAQTLQNCRLGLIRTPME
jgi:hypothetical protein